MGQPNATPRHRPSPIAPDRASRLLRAVEELRALDRERQRNAAASRRSDDLLRRVEAKAREVFRLAETEDDAPDRRH